MTVKEKFDKLAKYCGEHLCDDCLIYKEKGHTGSACFSLSDPQAVEEMFTLVFESDHEPEAKDTTKGKEEMEECKGCESCKHTDKTEKDYPCIACKRNYSFSDKMHWKYPDRWEPAEEAHADNVNHPAHYQGKHECIDEMIALFGRHAVMNFCACNVYKYRYRAAAKGGQEDLDKANWYMDKLIELKGESNDPF